MNEPRFERTEIFCHNCRNYVQFDLDMNNNGCYVLNCPVCGHEHCRVVENGRVTERRWASSAGLQTVTVVPTSNMTVTSSSTAVMSVGFQWSRNSTSTGSW